jgi:hypothetical protein
VFKTQRVSPAESEFCFALYITTETFISIKTLIKVARNITILCSIVMHGIRLRVQIDSVTESLSKVFVFVPDFLSLV